MELCFKEMDWGLITALLLASILLVSCLGFLLLVKKFYPEEYKRYILPKREKKKGDDE